MLLSYTLCNPVEFLLTYAVTSRYNSVRKTRVKSQNPHRRILDGNSKSAFPGEPVPYRKFLKLQGKK